MVCFFFFQISVFKTEVESIRNNNFILVYHFICNSTERVQQSINGQPFRIIQSENILLQPRSHKITVLNGAKAKSRKQRHKKRPKISWVEATVLNLMAFTS